MNENAIEIVGRFVEKLRVEIQNNHRFSLLYDYCAKAKQDLHGPLRVAITGTIKTGKSTLMNALLEQYIVPTAVEVMTYNVNWFHHIKYSNDGKEKIIVHLLNGEIKEYPMNKLESFVGFSTQHKDVLDKVHWVDVYLNHPLLEVFDLIDTPGLDSLMGTDSQHTRDLLTKDDNRPDAIIYLVYPEFKSKDILAVEEFHQATGLVSGINSIAALTRVDMLSGEFEEANNRIIDNKRIHADIRYFFLDVYPIAGLPAQASFIIQDDDIKMLRELVTIKDIDTFTANHDFFIDRFDWQTKSIREKLCTMLSIDGVRLTIKYFQLNPDATNSMYKLFLYNYSNVGLLKSVIIEQFGGRADFHKCNRVLSGMRKICAKISRQKELGQASRETLLKINQQVNQLDYQLHQEYAEYYILNDYYNQEDYFTDEEWENVRHILGEYGNEHFKRLQLPKDARQDTIKNAYNTQYEEWKRKASKYQLLGNVRANETALKIMNIIQTYKNKI